MFDYNSLLGKEIPVTQAHIDGIGADPVTLAMNEVLTEIGGKDVEFALYPAHEIADILENDGVVGTLMTAGTLDCWFQRYAWGHKMTLCTIHIYRQEFPPDGYTPEEVEEQEIEPDERLWIGIKEDSQMILVNVMNTFTKAEVGTFILCDAHFADLQASHVPALFNIRKLMHGFVGECIECCAKTDPAATLIEFDPTPEQIAVHVIFDDASGENWSASGRAGHLTYLCDNAGGIYTTKEALRRRGVSKLYIEAGYEVHIDDE